MKYLPYLAKTELRINDMFSLSLSLSPSSASQYRQTPTSQLIHDLISSFFFFSIWRKKIIPGERQWRNELEMEIASWGRERERKKESAR